MKNKYSVYEAKTHLSEILRQVKQNRTVVITDRGHEVARVMPMEEKTSFEKRVEALERAGVITPALSSKKIEFRPIAHRPGALKRFLETRNRY
jgi:prevent-host-death family protein